MSYLSKWFNKNKTPQSAPIPGTSQVPNSAGGFAFGVDDWTRLDRFLILGAEGGSYYASGSGRTTATGSGGTTGGTETGRAAGCSCALASAPSND